VTDMNIISVLIGLVILLIIIGVLFWAAQRILAVIPLAEPFRTLIYVLMVVIGVLIAIWVFVALLEAAGLHVNLFRIGALRLLSLA
jgi:hypothetical protein